jgi:cytochrome c peroxidase
LSPAKDAGRFKRPILRGLAARPPYFHNGFADSLDDVVEFHDTRFAMQLNPQEKRDLVAFLRSL